MAFKIHLLAPLLAAGLLSTLAAVQADTLVVSWNHKHPAWNNDKELGSVARIAPAFDLIAFQEVMSVDGLDPLKAELKALICENLTSMASDKIGRGSYLLRAICFRPAQR